MLRRHLQLSADVILHQTVEECLILIIHQIIITDAGADEHFLYPRQGPHGVEHLHIMRMIDLQVRARLGPQALPFRTGTVFCLFVTGRAGEIRARSADIMDIPLERGHRGDLLRLFHHAVHAAGRDHAPLMRSDGAKGTGAEAAAVARDREQSSAASMAGT